MHRSGSSCCSGSMQFLGPDAVSYGKHHLLEKNQWNEKGFFENELIWKFNKHTLELVGASWKDIKMTWTPKQRLTIMARLPQLVQIFKDDFINNPQPFFVIKDPRIVWLWDLYLAAFSQLGIELFVVHIERDETEVARSLWDPHKIPYDKALKLTRDHRTKIAENLKGVPVLRQVHITYNGLLTSPVATLQSVAKTLGTNTDSIKTQALTQFVDKSLKHF